MAQPKRKLVDAAQSQPVKSPLDLAEEQQEDPTQPEASATPPDSAPARPRARRKPAGKRSPKTSPAAPAPPPAAERAGRTTDQLTVSLLHEEFETLDSRSLGLRTQGHRSLKRSRLVRVALKLLENTSDEEILRIAEDVPDLEQLRVKPR